MQEVKLPHLGEGIDKIEVALWHCDEGSRVEQGQDLLEVVTDKASFNIETPSSGVLKEKRFNEGEVVKEGDVLGVIENVALS